MAREGKMAVSNATISGGVEILNRPPYEGVPMTLDADEFKNSEVVKAGSLITNDAKTAKHGTDDDKVAGVLLFDVYKDRPQGTILKKAYVNTTRVKESLGDAFTEQYGGSINAKVKAALPMVVFEELPKTD